MIVWKTELTAFLHDLLSHIEQQIRLAKTEPNLQREAVASASAVIPLLRSRGLDSSHGWALKLVFGDWCDGPWLKAWAELADLPTDKFSRVASDLLESVASLKKALGDPAAPRTTV